MAFGFIAAAVLATSAGAAEQAHPKGYIPRSEGVPHEIAYSAVSDGVLVYASTDELGSLVLSAPEGMVFREVVFASYGTPQAGEPEYSQGACHSSRSMKVVTDVFLNQRQGALFVHEGLFGDPCVGVAKRLAVVLKAY